jgi:hypothetical protein
MTNRAFLSACLAATGLVALLLTAGSWAEAASSYHVFVPIVSRDAPPTAVPSPTPIPTATPTPVPAAFYAVGISSGTSPVICLNAPAVGVAVSLVNGQVQLVAGAPIAVYYRYPAITGYYQTTSQTVVTDSTGTTAAVFAVDGFIYGVPGDVLQFQATFTSGGRTYYSQVVTQTLVSC